MSVDLAVVINLIDPDFLGKMDLEELCSFTKLFNELGSNKVAFLKAKDIWLNNK